MLEWRAIENGWPRRFACLNEAPAEFAQALLYLLRTSQAYKQSIEVFAAVKERERALLDQIARQTLGSMH